MDIKLDCEMDIDRKLSWSLPHTPASGAGTPAPSFNITGCGHFCARKAYFTARSGFERHLYIHTLAGAGRVIFRDREILLRPGQAVVLDCREQQYYGTAETDSDGFWRFNFIHFSGAAAETYEKALNGESFSACPSDDGLLRDLFDQMVTELKNRGVLVEFKTAEIITTLLTRLIESRHLHGAKGPAARYHHEIETVLAFIRQHYAGEIRVETLAAMLPVSRFHFIRIFRAYTGTSPYDYLILHRINKAKSLLKETPASVEETAYQVGFNDPSNFIRYFRKIVGTTPENFRKYWIG